MKNLELNLLLIEDDEVDAEVIKRRLKPEGEMGRRAVGFRVCVATSIKEALGKMSGEDFDCVLLDLKLPDADEMQGLCKLVSEYPNTPVVVVSGDGEEGVALESLENGANDFIEKSSITRRGLVRAILFAIKRGKFRPRGGYVVDEGVEERLIRDVENLRALRSLASKGA